MIGEIEEHSRAAASIPYIVFLLMMISGAIKVAAILLTIRLFTVSALPTLATPLPHSWEIPKQLQEDSTPSKRLTS